MACSSIQEPGANSWEKILVRSRSATSSYNGLGVSKDFEFIIMNSLDYFCQVCVKP